MATVIKDTEHAAASASDLADQARNHALDPTLSGSELKDARECMDDAAFKRERLQRPWENCGSGSQNARRQLAYDKAKAVRDDLAKELADLYPAFVQKLAELLPRIAANDRKIEYINGHALPSGAKRLLVAELVARGLEGFMHNSIATPRLTEELCLPAFECSAHDRYAWPRSR